MEESSLKILKERLAGEGFQQKAILSDSQMNELGNALGRNPRVLSTPPEELRYLEGLVDLPLGHLAYFKVIPAKGNERCKCGRTPSALDIVQTALARRLHDKSLVRDTLIGFKNIFESAKDGRNGECIRCGRPVVMESYWTNAYAYA